MSALPAFSAWAGLLYPAAGLLLLGVSGLFAAAGRYAIGDAADRETADWLLGGAWGFLASATVVVGLTLLWPPFGVWLWGLWP